MNKLILLFFIIGIIFCKDLIIESVNRNIYLKTHVVREQFRVKFKNNGNERVEKVLFSIKKEKLEHVGYFVAAVAGETDELKISKPYKSKVDGVYYYDISLPEALVPKSSISLDIILTLIKYVNPLPLSIKQNENQKLIFIDNVFFYSPYVVQSQTTNVELPGSQIESYTKDVMVSSKNQNLNYGPFSKQNEFSEKELKVHYLYNHPYVNIKSLLKEVEISHWGNLAIEEHYVVEHAGARLKGGFSRLDFQRGYPNSAPSHFRALTAYLPLSARDIYFRDRIGNISTSDCKVSDDKKHLLVDFNQRFPLFGGWKNTFYIGYNLPLVDYLKSKGNTYMLNASFSTPFQEAPIEDFTLKIIIPEGSSKEKAIIPFEVDSQFIENRKTYLDTFGRTVIVIKKKNVCPEHGKAFQVIYNFNFTSFLMEPLLVIAGLFILCIISMIYVRIDLTISKSRKMLKEEKSRIEEELLEKYVVINYDRELLYIKLEDGTPLINQGMDDEYKNLKEEVVKERNELLEKIKKNVISKIKDSETIKIVKVIEELDSKKFEIVENIQNNLKNIKVNEDDKKKITSFRTKNRDLEEKYDELSDKIMEKINYIK